MDPILLMSPALAFVVTFILTRKWIPVAARIGLTGKDMNKPTRPPVANMGGIALISGILGGVLFYIAINTFLLDQSAFNLDLFAILTTILIIAFIGLIDDMLGWKIGLSQLQKPLLTLPAALPMMVVNAGVSVIALPFMGNVSLGIIFPFVLVPIGVVGASNAFNIIAGYNGLEAGMGIIIIGALSIAAYFVGATWVTIVGIVAVAALLAFIYFNWYPAKIFPGNAFTYMIGAVIACMAIFAHAEKLALLLFIPYYIDFLFNLRGRLKVEAFAIVNNNWTLEKPSAKICHLTHLMLVVIKKIKGNVYEQDVTLAILGLEAVVAAIALALFFF